MNNISRRDFLKGLLAVSVAATVLPNLPEVAEAAPIVAEEAKIFIAPRTVYGRLGRIRLDSIWYPLEDAAISLVRSHSPLLYADPTQNWDRPVVEQEYQTSFYARPQGSPLVSSPWQITVWSPEMEMLGEFDGGTMREFEIDTRSTRFSGRGFVTEVMTEIGEIDGPPVLFSLTLEGMEKMRRWREIDGNI